jgi:hypothetical protein
MKRAQVAKNLGVIYGLQMENIPAGLGDSRENLGQPIEVMHYEDLGLYCTWWRMK